MSSAAITGIHQVDTLPRSASSTHSDVKMGEYDDGLLAFVPVRPRLFGIAYRILGSASEADDIVQDVWLRWQSTDRSVVENPHAFLKTITTRLCINLANSAHARRETYVETWLPEPVDRSSDPALGAERREELKRAVVVLLEKLSPTERAAYILHEAFDYSYRQIADFLQMQEANTRQVVSRARKHIGGSRRSPARPSQQRHLFGAFVAASQKGEMAALEDLLAENIVSCGGPTGTVRADDCQFLGATVQ